MVATLALVAVALGAGGCASVCNGKVLAVQSLGADVKLTIRPQGRTERPNCFVTDHAASLINCKVGSTYPDCAN
jgi:hypothetical protein